MRHCLLGLTLCAATLIGRAQAQDTTSVRPASPAVLTGVVQDSTGAAIAGAEIRVLGAGTGAYADSLGRFTVSVLAAGSYEVWFRRVGYEAAPFQWAARNGERTSLAVRLHHLPRLLDTVIVRARENARMYGRSVVSGLVIDSAGQPIPEAEVQLLGTGMVTVTRDDGTFVFRRVGRGAYTLRARKLGYSPNVLAMDITGDEERSVVIRVRDLPQTLDAMVIAARSGYERSGQGWEEFDRRQQWRTTDARIIGPEELRNAGGMSFDHLVHMLAGGQEHVTAMRRSRGAQSFYSRPAGMPGAAATQDACILVNGTDLRIEPLSAIDTKAVQMVEVYPSGTELTGTVAAHMPASCSGPGLDHPTFYVVWMKDAQ